MRLLTLASLLLAGVYGAMGATSTYTFTGRCTDCTGNGVGQLVVQNYTPGTSLTNANFVSFTYQSNLLTISLSATDNPTLSGVLPAPLPGPAAVSILGSRLHDQLVTQASGSWCGGLSCTSDFGSSSSWAVSSGTPAPTVPVANNVVLVGIAAALATMGVLYLKRSAAAGQA